MDTERGIGTRGKKKEGEWKNEKKNRGQVRTTPIHDVTVPGIEVAIVKWLNEI